MRTISCGTTKRGTCKHENIMFSAVTHMANFHEKGANGDFFVSLNYIFLTQRFIELNGYLLNGARYSLHGHI